MEGRFRYEMNPGADAELRYSIDFREEIALVLKDLVTSLDVQVKAYMRIHDIAKVADVSRNLSRSFRDRFVDNFFDGGFSSIPTVVLVPPEPCSPRFCFCRIPLGTIRHRFCLACGLRDTEERIQLWYVAIQVFHNHVVGCIYRFTWDSVGQKALEDHLGRFPDSLLIGLCGRFVPKFALR
jgi:hypothetical protein